MTPIMAIERLFKYPPMERQDLNQTQLGSFKFTPVDSVTNVQDLTQSARQFLEQQLIQRQRLPGSPPSSIGPWKYNATPWSFERLAAHPQPVEGLRDFFNKHIKPDIGESRLRLGPAALRSAVDNATSPVKTSPTRLAQQELDFNMSYHQPPNSTEVGIL
jgi:hypothetical protein